MGGGEYVSQLINDLYIEYIKKDFHLKMILKNDEN